MAPYTLKINNARFKFLQRTVSAVVLTAFILTSVKSPAYAQSISVDPAPFMPTPGVMVHLSPEFTPAYLKGIVIHPEDALKFDFIIYKGDREFDDSQKKQEYTKLIKYFMASLAVPDEDQWVNLSPYERDRIIQDDFGKTEMGRDLLAEDYILKQITASLIYPKDNLGKKFWDEIYQKAYQQFGTTNIPINTFNKVWIMPDGADVYEKGNIAFVYRSHLKVMLEEDYLSLKKHSGIESLRPQQDNNKAHSIASQIVRQIILPQLEKEVNEGKNFAMLRQMYSGMILATWYKQALKESLLGKVYANKDKLKGVNQDPKNNEVIYQRYLKAFKKGVFNYIKEDVDKYTNESIPRKYFSGGFVKSINLDRHSQGDVAANNQTVEQLGDGSDFNIANAMVAEVPEARAMLTKPEASWNPSSEMRADNLVRVRAGGETVNDLWNRIVGRQYDFTGITDKFRAVNPKVNLTSDPNAGDFTVPEGEIVHMPYAHLHIHTVLEGQTLERIANAYGILPQRILGTNSELAQGAPLRAGQSVYVYLADAQETFFEKFKLTDPKLWHEFPEEPSLHENVYGSKSKAMISLKKVPKAVKIVGWTFTVLTAAVFSLGYYGNYLQERDAARRALIENIATDRNTGEKYNIKDWALHPQNDWKQFSGEAAQNEINRLRQEGKLGSNEVAARVVFNHEEGSLSYLLGLVTVNSNVDQKSSELNGKKLEEIVSQGTPIYVWGYQSVELQVPQGSTVFDTLSNIVGTNNVMDAFNGFSANFLNIVASLNVKGPVVLYGIEPASLAGKFDEAAKAAPAMMTWNPAMRAQQVREFLSLNKRFVFTMLALSGMILLSAPFIPLDHVVGYEIGHLKQPVIISPYRSTIDFTYRTQIGETLETIAHNYGVSPENILKIEENYYLRRDYKPGHPLKQRTSFMIKAPKSVLTGTNAIKLDHYNWAATGVDGAMLTANLARRTSAGIRQNQKVLRGGIDFNSANLNLQIKRDGRGVPLPLSQQNLENIHIDGLIPVILSIRPAVSSPLVSQLRLNPNNS